MANPSDIAGFQFVLEFEFTPDGGTTWELARVGTGDGQAGLDNAQHQYDSISAQMAETPEAMNVRNVRVAYASIQQWTEWETAPA